MSVGVGVGLELISPSPAARVGLAGAGRFASSRSRALVTAFARGQPCEPQGILGSFKMAPSRSPARAGGALSLLLCESGCLPEVNLTVSQGPLHPPTHDWLPLEFLTLGLVLLSPQQLLSYLSAVPAQALDPAELPRLEPLLREAVPLLSAVLPRLSFSVSSPHLWKQEMLIFSLFSFLLC